MHSFAKSSHISEEICHVLAREWCAKLNYYYQAWLDAGAQPDFDFETVEAYHLSEFFFDALEGVPADSPTFTRFLEVAEWTPRARPP